MADESARLFFYEIEQHVFHQINTFQPSRTEDGIYSYT